MPIGFKGHVRRPDKDLLQAISNKQYGRHLQAMMAIPLPAKWDSRTVWSLTPIKDQAQCGSCWDFSGVFVVETAFAVAGYPGIILSEEYVLSCLHNGGCSGDDNVTVLDAAKSAGLPQTSDYGPYTARRGSCAFKSAMKMFKLDGWGFANSSGDTGQTVTPTDDIKQAIMKYGCVGCAIAAGGDAFWNSGTGTGVGRSSQIDHDINYVGWDDDHDNGDGTKGAWIMRNSWAKTWGVDGYAMVKYGAYDGGTEAVFGYVNPTSQDWDV